jgi:hypothetical protein
VYTFSEIAELVELPGAFMIGAGAGPHRHVGCCEVNINMLYTGNKKHAIFHILKYNILNNYT